MAQAKLKHCYLQAAAQNRRGCPYYARDLFVLFVMFWTPFDHFLLFQNLLLTLLRLLKPSLFLLGVASFQEGHTNHEPENAQYTILWLISEKNICRARPSR